MLPQSTMSVHHLFFFTQTNKQTKKKKQERKEWRMKESFFFFCGEGAEPVGAFFEVLEEVLVKLLDKVLGGSGLLEGLTCDVDLHERVFLS